ncbi:hypothetical protein LCH21_02940 [Patescibacteria group bacterium]|nr:hypothetical protein [Patescibacteria group bacterium]
MIKGLLISICAVIVIGLLFMFPGDTISSDDIHDYTLNKAYLAKNTEQYARCYNSVNYGTSGLTDIELALMSEHFNDPRVSSETMKPIEQSFMNEVKQKCDKFINDYESAYKKVEAIQSKSQSLRVGWRTFVFGSGNQSMPSGEIFQYSPSSARMKTSFNDYVFTEQDATEYFKKQLNL